jgi:hypothetical protein
VQRRRGQRATVRRLTVVVAQQVRDAARRCILAGIAAARLTPLRFQWYGSPRDAQAQVRHSKLEMTGWYMKQIPETVRAPAERRDGGVGATARCKGSKAGCRKKAYGCRRRLFSSCGP